MGLIENTVLLQKLIFTGLLGRNEQLNSTHTHRIQTPQLQLIEFDAISNH